MEVTTLKIIQDLICKQFPWLHNLFIDPNVSDIWLNSIDNVYFERHGNVEKLAVSDLTENRLMDLAYAFAAVANKPLNVRIPYLESSYPVTSNQNIRVQAVIPPVAREHAIFSFRKPSRNHFGLEQLQVSGFCSERTVHQLREVIRSRSNLLISGATGTGKTTLVQAILNEIAQQERIVILEDTAELFLPNPSNGACLQTRELLKDSATIQLSDLLKLAMRMKPDRLVIGEVRGQEAFGFVQAMNTGHRGCISTIHANSNQDALLRLETLLLLTDGITPTFARRMLKSAIDVCIHIHRDPMRGREIAEMAKLSIQDETIYSLRILSKQS